MVTCKKLGGTDMFVYCILCFNYRLNKIIYSYVCIYTCIYM